MEVSIDYFAHFLPMQGHILNYKHVEHLDKEFTLHSLSLESNCMMIDFTFKVAIRKYLTSLESNADDDDEAGFISKVNKHHFYLMCIRMVCYYNVVFHFQSQN
jgi:hypothetical protein